MALSRTQRRSYHEAWHRHSRGSPSQGYRGSELDVEVWVQAFQLGNEAELSPWDALLLAVRRRAARVRWVDSVIAELIAQEQKEAQELDQEEGREPQPPPAPSAEVRAWLTESRNEERLLTRAAKMAVDAGVADAVVRRLELEGRLVTDALVAGLDSLQLSSEQRLRALSTMHRALAAGTDAEVPDSMPTLGSGDVQDAEVVDDQPKSEDDDDDGDTSAS